MVISGVNGNIGIRKDIIKLVKDIKYLLTRFIENRLEYCNMILNMDVDVLVKIAHL